MCPRERERERAINSHYMRVCLILFWNVYHPYKNNRITILCRIEPANRRRRRSSSPAITLLRPRVGWVLVFPILYLLHLRHHHFLFLSGTCCPCVCVCIVSCVVDKRTIMPIERFCAISVRAYPFVSHLEMCVAHISLMRCAKPLYIV